MHMEMREHQQKDKIQYSEHLLLKAVVLDNRAQALGLTNQYIKVVQAAALVMAAAVEALADKEFNHNNLAILELMDLEIQAVQHQTKHHTMEMVVVVLVVLPEHGVLLPLELLDLVKHIQSLVHR